MYQPAKTFCDICGEEIKDGAHRSVIESPVPKSVRDLVVKALEAENKAPAAAGGGVLGFGQLPAEWRVAHTWQFVICVGCTTGFLPMEKMVKAIQTAMQARITARRETEKSMEELEESVNL